MRAAYKIILTREKNGMYTAFAPDFDSRTQGKNATDAIYKARDMIGTTGIALQDMGKDIPVSGSVECRPARNEIATYVGVDFAEYRRRLKNR